MTQFDPQAVARAAGEAMTRIKAVLAAEGVNPAALAKGRDILLELTADKSRFPIEIFQPPGANANMLYCLAEDADGTNALYLSSERHQEDRATLPHNHLTWAIIVGLEGSELNRLYRRADDGSVPGRGEVRQTGEVELRHGTGLFLMPEEIHSVHAKGGHAMLSMHVYGLSMPRQTERIEFLPDGTTRQRRPNPNIRAIPGLG